MIVVTGANGFLGKSICAELVKRGIAFRPITARLMSLSSADFVGASVVIHCAAKIPHLNISNSEYFDANYYGTLRTLQLAKELGVEKFVFISSMSVIADGYYEASKRLAECLGRSA